MENSLEPVLNRETPLAALALDRTPDGAFYRRSNFAVPRLDAAGWELPVRGGVEHPITFTMDTLHALPRHEATVTMECAGNGRAALLPPAPGVQWGLGAVSTATFAGARLSDVLAAARPRPDAVEVLFTGADRGLVGGHGPERPFARSLPLASALDGDVLLAWEMNGEPLPTEHGYPLRLVVPRWYGVASVKWLAEVRVLAEPFRGHFQAEKYVYLQEAGTPDGTPVTRMRVRALIASPSDGDAVVAGVELELRGTAWSGEGEVVRVEVSADGGRSWRAAELEAAPSAHAARPWHLGWLPPGAGTHELIVRGTDAAGNTQPLEQVWNALGYGNNAAQRVRVTAL
jgi:sulfane dehydrogenase subunit SoxC